MTQAYALLLDNVRLVRKSWRIRRAFEGLLLAAAVGGGALTLAAVLDRLLEMNLFGRWFLFLACGSALAVVAHLFIVRPLLATHSDDYFAALIEQRHPDLRNRLINALQLGRQDAAHATGSMRLIEAIVADGAAAVDVVDPGRAVAEPALRRFAAALGGAAAAAMVFVWLAGPAASVSARRVMMPWADILPFAWTTLTVTPDEPQSLLEGTPLEIRAITAGRYPDEASVTWVDAQNHRRTMRMASNGRVSHAFAYTFPSVDAPFEFFVTAGDARSHRVRVAVTPRPRLTAVGVTYHYPAYTGLPDRKLDETDAHLHGLPQTDAALSLRANKPLDKLTLVPDSGPPVEMQATADATVWTGRLTLTANGGFFFKLADKLGNSVDDPTRYLITLDPDAPPAVAFAKPGRDMQVKPDDTIDFAIVAQDDYGVGPVTMLGKIAGARAAADTADAAGAAATISRWANDSQPPQRRVELSLKKTVAELGLKPGDRLEYWATVLDRNDISPAGPGKGESRRYTLHVLTPDQAQVLIEKQLTEYAKALTELIRMQRLNRTQTEGIQPAAGLISRESLIRRGTEQLADLMRRNAFPGQTIIDDLSTLAADPMVKVIAMLESYRDATDLEVGKVLAAQSLPMQDRIIEKLEEILKRINRDQVVRTDLRKLKTDVAADVQVQGAMGKLAKDLDQFLAEQRDLKERYEKMAKRDADDAKGEDPDALNEAKHRLDRWKQWAKDTVDGLTKLPEGFVKDSALAETLPAIFEETEKQPKGAVSEIATPSEEGMKVISTKVLEDLEVWMMAHGDNVRWAMEEPPEGRFQVQPSPLSANLQDLVGDLIEDMKDFDEEADDATSSWGGDMPQGGWDIADGPMSTFSAQGKTGNQLPNANEASGRSGSGRRGRSSGQAVGDEAMSMEGRPTPARVTNEPYEKGQPKSGKQLDPRGATGGGKKTGGGLPGLQGGSKPDFVKDMQRLAENQAMLREKTQQVARQLENAGRSSSHVNRALQLMQGSEQDLRDLRYDDAARKRKTALSELRAEENQIDQAVNVSLQKAQSLPPEMRQQIGAAAQQALPEGYEDLVGAYYKALSGASDNPK